jgi:pilus assembly protein CpaF
MIELPGRSAAASHQPARTPSDIVMTDLYQDLKFRVFNLVLEHFDAKGVTVDSISRAALVEEIGQAASIVLLSQGGGLNTSERDWLLEDVRNEITGLGPLEPLLSDPTIDDIIVNGPFRIYVERGGKLGRTPGRFRNDAHLMNIIQRIVSPIGRRVDEASPFVDARLADGSRVNIVIPPISLDGPIISIRKFKEQPLRAEDYLRGASISREMLEFLAAAVRARLNILIVGGTGSGKTTLLNMLSGFIGEHERLITIEDAAELRLRQSHVVRLETRPPSSDGAREISARDLVRNALRMRPDRIILGEVRGVEAVEMLQAMNTGHEGSMATIHANSPRDALARIEMLLGFGGVEADPKTLRRYIVGSLQVLVQIARMAGGQRRVTKICELIGLKGDNFVLHDLFAFDERPPLSGSGNFTVVSRRPHYSYRLGPSYSIGDEENRL